MSMGLKPEKIFISIQFYVFKTTYALLCYSLKTTNCVWQKKTNAKDVRDEL